MFQILEYLPYLIFFSTGGAPCPPNRQLEEAQHCPTTIECAIYVWQTGPWGPCMVVNRSSNCGDGTQTRDANCYSLKGQLVSDQRYG